jgi:hypothetical protein
MRDAVLKLIRSEPTEDLDNIFNDLAKRIFQYQFEYNAPYRKFCLTEHKSPDQINRWEEIPALPVTAFKWVNVACQPIEHARKLFYSSGTTQGQRGSRSLHAVFDLEIARAAILSHFKRHVLNQEGERPLRTDDEKVRFCILTPSPGEAPHSSLSYMMEVVREAYGTEDSEYYIHQGRLLSEKLLYDLSQDDIPLQDQKPVILIGTSFSFVHFIDFLMERPEVISLPAGSKMMDTGGFKGKSRTVSSHWLYAMIEKRLGIPVNYCCNEYGMAEMTSQFYDSIAGIPHLRVYRAPPQTRWQILSPFTRMPVKKGEVGLLAIYDLANIDSVSAILTEDLAKEATEGKGFMLMGRATGAETRGCSVDIDTLLTE